MSKRLKLSPAVSYVLGLYAYNDSKAIGIVTKSSEIVQRFVKTSIDELGIEPNKILIEAGEDETIVYYYNSKLKKLMDQALERKERLFKYKNDYSASYFAGIYDVKGGKDSKSVYMRDLDKTDDILLEKLGFHTEQHGAKSHIANENTFILFIKRFSAKLS